MRLLPAFLTRTYATSPASRSARASSIKGAVPSLDHWIQRSKALSLWREIVRAVNRIPNSSTKQEMRAFARAEFERHRGVTDIGHVRYLISTGKTEFDAMRRYVDEQAA